MTYYEVLYWWAWLVVPIFIIIITSFLSPEDDLGPPILIGCFILFGGGIMTTTLTGERKDYKITSKFETIPKVVHLDDTGLNVITDEDKHVKYTTHKDITTWKNGGKFYKVYSFNKEHFGVDGTKDGIVIELEKVEK